MSISCATLTETNGITIKEILKKVQNDDRRMPRNDEE